MMTRDEFNQLEEGDLVQSVTTGHGYVIHAVTEDLYYNGRCCIGVRIQMIGDPLSWKLVGKMTDVEK